MAPGLTAFARMPWGAHSRAAVLVKPAAQFGVFREHAQRPAQAPSFPTSSDEATNLGAPRINALRSLIRELEQGVIVVFTRLLQDQPSTWRSPQQPADPIIESNAPPICGTSREV